MTCPACGREVDALRDGVCLDCWYASDDRPKPVRDRYAKLERLRELGVEPYAYSFDPTHRLAEAKAAFEDMEGEMPGATGADEASPPGVEVPGVRVAGRILSYRDLGGSAFAHLGDLDGRLQIHLKKNLLGEDGAALMELLDLGDWIGVEGDLFRTRRGEVTVRVTALTLLSKTLRPLPFGKEEVREDGERIVHSGFSDQAQRYRQRYADLAVNPDVREVFRTRTRITTELRRWLDARGFIEVETPVLQPLYGGALARPFTTHHHTLDQDVYLRIADELYLKRLIVGNLDRVYEIGHDFRNEGIDRTHNPEFTMLELYYAYSDYRDVMELTETLVSDVVMAVAGTTRFEWDGMEVDLAAPWKRVAWADAFEEGTGLDPSTVPDDELVAAAKRTGREDAAELSRMQLLDVLFTAAVEDGIVDPTMIYDHPIELSPLAKPTRGDPRYAERFEAVVCGFELVNAFSELNDPLDQYRRFAAQAQLRAAGDEEAMPIDEDYVRALEYGLPPTGGFGMGVDRLVMLVTGQTSIRDVVLYPMLRPEEGAE
ncbi:MAG: lysine--tRNA ligase [Gemmatimonadota bacterium]|nr:lysine--tRNA ligase [Gemmatimonadota bacterium]